MLNSLKQQDNNQKVKKPKAATAQQKALQDFPANLALY
jgi:hypothetical protein